MLKSFIFVFCKRLKGCPQTNLWPKLGFWSSQGEPGEGRGGWNMYLNGGNSIVNSLCTDWPECSKCSKCWICTTQQMSTPPWSDGEKSVHWSRLSQVGGKYCVAGISFIHGCGCGGGKGKQMIGSLGNKGNAGKRRDSREMSQTSNPGNWSGNVRNKQSQIRWTLS